MSRLLLLAIKPIEVTVVDDGGFDWVAACVGAAATVGLMLVVAGASLARSTRKRSEGEP